MHKPIIAIDVDGVLRDNLGIMVDIYNSEFNEDKKIEEITDFRTEVSFPRIENETGKTASQWFFQDHSTEIFLNAKPFKNVKEDVKRLQEYGEVVIITYQKSYKNKMETLKWLEDNEIEPSGIVFLKNKTLLNCDYLIDDNDWNFVGTRARFGGLISAPYNKHISTWELSQKAHCPIARFSSLNEFTEWFVKKEQEKTED